MLESHFIIEKRRGVVVDTTTQLDSARPAHKFCTGSNSARGVSEICNDESLWQWPWLEIRLIIFHRSTIPLRQFIIIIIIGIIFLLMSPTSNYWSKSHRTFNSRIYQELYKSWTYITTIVVWLIIKISLDLIWKRKKLKIN